MPWQNQFLHKFIFFIAFFSCTIAPAFCQPNLLLNGDFQDMNTCMEYKAECGVEAWFYLKDVKVQMIHDEKDTGSANATSFTIFYTWNGYKEFTPIIGTILPCSLQKGKQYIFKGWLSARLSPKLILKPGVCVGESFYVPRRPFSKEMKPDKIVQLKQVAATPFAEFEYTFIADGNERYLTFGTFVAEDTSEIKKGTLGAQPVTITPNHFSLTSTDPAETFCAAYKANKESIYRYDYRHKDMDYALYGKGKLPVTLSEDLKDNLTRNDTPPPPSAKPDTLKMGDVLFDFNKADLKASATNLLEAFFKNNKDKRTVDSIYIEGHTDSIGSDTKNILLSRLRSESVMKWLIANTTLLNDRITIHAFGRARPLASNNTPAGRALNRRVEVIVFRQQH